MSSRNGRLRLALVIALAGVCALAAAAYWGLDAVTHLKQTNAKFAAAQHQPLPVQVDTAVRGVFDQELGGEATAGGSATLNIGTIISAATVVGAHFRIGDVLKADAPMFELDPAEEEATLQSEQQDVDNARSALDLNHKRVDALRDLMGRGLAYSDELRQASDDESQLHDRIAQAQIKLQEARTELKATRMKTPVASVVTAGELHPGMVVHAGSTIATLARIDPIWVTVTLGEDKIRYTYLGQDAEVSFYSFPDRKYHGKVIVIEPTVNVQTRLASVIVRLDNPKLELLPGMAGVATLHINREALRVPGVAVITARNGASYVFVVDQDKVAHLRNVTIGAASGGFVEIESGLNDGETVVVVGQTRLADNDSVRIGTEYVINK